MTETIADYLARRAEPEAAIVTVRRAGGRRAGPRPDLLAI